MEINEAINQTNDWIIAQARAILKARHRPGQPLDSPDRVRTYLQLKLGKKRNECFGLLLLNTKHIIIRDTVLVTGTIDSASVPTRRVIECVFRANAAAVIFYHNHPSNNAEPSKADELLTKRLKDALALIEVRVLDHLIVTAHDSTSLAERGLL